MPLGQWSAVDLMFSVCQKKRREACCPSQRRCHLPGGRDLARAMNLHELSRDTFTMHRVVHDVVKMPLIVSGEAAARIARAQRTTKGQPNSSISLSETSCSGEPSFELLVSTISPLVISTEHHSRNGSLQGSKTAAITSTTNGLTVHDPDAEITVSGDDLGRLKLYDGSLVRVRSSYPCQMHPMSIQRGTFCSLVVHVRLICAVLHEDSSQVLTAIVWLRKAAVAQLPGRF